MKILTIVVCTLWPELGFPSPHSCIWHPEETGPRHPEVQTVCICFPQCCKLFFKYFGFEKAPDEIVAFSISILTPVGIYKGNANLMLCSNTFDSSVSSVRAIHLSVYVPAHKNVLSPILPTPP